MLAETFSFESVFIFTGVVGRRRTKAYITCTLAQTL